MERTDEELIEQFATAESLHLNFKEIAKAHCDWDAAEYHGDQARYYGQMKRTVEARNV